MRFLLAVMLAAGVSVSAASRASAQNVIFEDDFDDNAAGWVFTSLSGDLNADPNNGSLGFAGDDYSQFGVPEAPNSQPGDTPQTGFTLRTNVGFGAEDQAGFSLQNEAFTGDFTVQVDMWLNWSTDPSQNGTTEHGGIFVGQPTASNPIDPTFPVQQGAGTLLSTDGDCTNCDYILLKNRAELDTFSGQYSVTDFGFGNQPGYDETDVNTDAANGDLINLAAIFPSFSITDATGGEQTPTPELDTQPAGVVGFQWVTLTVEVDTDSLGSGDGPDVGFATFSITNANTGETFELGTVDNSIADILDDDMNGVDCELPGDNPSTEDICTGEGPVDLEGQITLAIVDFFPSIASDALLAFALFDNLVVFETPSGGLLGDFNNDGSVDAADYTVWRDGLEEGTFTLDDYLDWQSNFGATASTASATAAPEPAGAAVVLMASAAFGHRRRAGFSRR